MKAPRITHDSIADVTVHLLRARSQAELYGLTALVEDLTALIHRYDPDFAFQEHVSENAVPERVPGHTPTKQQNNQII